MAIKDCNDYAQVGEALKPLHRFARTHDTHVLVIHHQGKAGDSPLGSTALSANVDTIMTLGEGEQGCVLETKQRYGDPLPKTLLAFDAATRTLSLAGARAVARQRTLEDEIVWVLGRGVTTEAALRDALGCKAERLSRALNDLVVEGVLERSGKGARNNPFVYAVSALYHRGDDADDAHDADQV